MENRIKLAAHEQMEKLVSLIRDIKIAMLTTIDEDGRIHSRPMVTQQIKVDGELWFISDEMTHKIDELKKSSQVHLSYADEKSQRFVSISGQAHVVRDPDQIKSLWNPSFQTWLPKVEEPSKLVLLKVKVEQVEYWDSLSSSAVHLVGLAKAG